MERNQLESGKGREGEKKHEKDKAHKVTDDRKQLHKLRNSTKGRDRDRQREEGNAGKVF